MIIKTDVRNIPSSKFPLTRNQSELSVSHNDPESGRISLKNITNRLGIERSLGDALSIAQMSQNVIQKAISISLRLRSIATSAMASGSVNTQELTETLSDIRSTLGAYGEQVPNPVQASAAPSAKIVEIPDYSREIASVSTIAQTIQSGNYKQIDQIEAVNRNLNDKLKNYRITENRITDLMRETTASYTPAVRIHSGELVGQIKTSIETNPGYALSAQGNINHTAAERLMA